MRLREHATVGRCQNRNTDYKGRHTKVSASSTPASLGIGAAEARAMTREKIELNTNIKIQKGEHTAGKDNSGECLDLHIMWR